VLAKVLQELLVMLHPLMPHITEELWHGLTGAPSHEFLAMAPWPVASNRIQNYNPGVENSFAIVIEAIRIARNLRAVAGVKPSQKVPRLIIIDSGSASVSEIYEGATEDIKALAKVKSLSVHSDDLGNAGMRCLAGVSGSLQVLLPLAGIADIDSLRSRLKKDLAKAEKEVAALTARLGNPNFAEKAPPLVVAECRANLNEAETQADLARKRLADLA